MARTKTLALALIGLGALSLTQIASANAPVRERTLAAPVPFAAPVPMASSTVAHRYWPVVTSLAQATVAPAHLFDGKVQGAPLRSFDTRRPADPSKPQTRRHVGVDLTAAEGDTVVAMEDGKIVNFYPFLARAASVGGENTYAILVQHKDYVALYGEVRASSLTAKGLKVGDRVAAGQPIGVVSGTAQLHTETYASGVTRNIKWPVGAPPPREMRNPTQLLLDTALTGERIYPKTLRLAAS
ncbi:hypothetical protein BH10PSE5_BH10PSE5_16080 [soil metagenome]